MTPSFYNRAYQGRKYDWPNTAPAHYSQSASFQRAGEL